MPETHAIWDSIRSELEAVVPETAYSLWLSDLQITSLAPSVVHLVAPGHAVPWIERRFKTLIESIVRDHLGSSPRVTITPSGSTRDSFVEVPSDVGSNSARSDVVATFADFVIGESNHLAHAAAIAVSESPGLSFNPLYIFGSPGLGKTHLLHSICAYSTAIDASLRVLHVTAEEFTVDFITALRSKAMDDFKLKYRTVDILLLDDVQYLVGKPQTADELFSVVSYLVGSGRQVVVTADRPPQRLDRLNTQLRVRFESGLVTEISPPNLDTRVSILKKRIATDCLQVVDQTVLRNIAARAPLNVRSLTGLLVRLIAEASLIGKPITVEFANSTLSSSDEKQPSDQVIPFDNRLRYVMSSVAQYYDVTVEDLVGKSRRTQITMARHVAMYVARATTNISVSEIGHHFGGRDHTTVLSATRKIEKLMITDHDLGDLVHTLSTKVSTDNQRQRNAADYSPVNAAGVS